MVLLTWREDGRYGRALYGLGRVQQADWAGPPQQVGLRVPPIVNPAQSVRREWGRGGARGSPKVKVEGLSCWGWDVEIFKLFIYNITV